MKYVLVACALLVSPAIANAGNEPRERMSLGSARTTLDMNQCLDQKLAFLGMPVVAGTAPLTTIAYGQGKDLVDVEITDGGTCGSLRSRPFASSRHTGRTISDPACIDLKCPAREQSLNASGRCRPSASEADECTRFFADGDDRE